MNQHDSAIDPPFPSIEGGCLAALARALAAESPQKSAERLLRGLREPLGLAGGLVLQRTADRAARVLAARDVPSDWVTAWTEAAPEELDRRTAVGRIRQPFGAEEGRLDPALREVGIRTLWVLPLGPPDRPAGALALVSRDDAAFPRDVRGTVEAVAAGFAGWLDARGEPGPPSDGSPGATASGWDRLASEPDLAVVPLAPDGTVRGWPPHARACLGWEPEEVVGQPVDMLFQEEDRPTLMHRLRGEGPTGEWAVPLRVNRGEALPCGVRLLVAGDAREATLVFRDRRAGAAAEVGFRSSRTLLDVLGLSTVVLDAGGRIREIGADWLATGGDDDASAWRGRHFASLVESDRREVLSGLRTAAKEGEWTGRLVVAGRPVPVTLRAVRDEDGNLEALVGARLAAAGGETGDLLHQVPMGVILLDPELRVVEANPEVEAVCDPGTIPGDPTGLDVRSLAPFQTRSAQSALQELALSGEVDAADVSLTGSEEDAPRVHLRGGRLTDASGTHTGFLLTLAGRTDKADVENHLMRAQKMESIGNLASGLAHDFGNFVAVILGKAGMLRVKLPADPHITNDLADIETAAKRAQHLAQELMRFARGGRGRRKKLDVSRLVEEVSALIRTSVGRHIRLELQLDADAPPVFGDEVELQQVIMNLCLNARDAMPDGGKLFIGTAPLRPEQKARLSASGDVEDGVCVFVRDTGEGIDEDTLDRIFEPFFTTKSESQRGTGLGLAMVYGIIRRHGGAIDVSSRPGRGTTFEILLPTAAAETVESATPSRTVLVVDDEAAFREMIRLILEEDGYGVRLAANGIEALRALRGSVDELSLVILDLRMPGLDGLGVLDEIRSLSESLPVLVTTGYASPEEKEDAIRRGAGRVLEKPYRVADLRGALADLFASTSEATASGAPALAKGSGPGGPAVPPGGEDRAP